MVLYLICRVHADLNDISGDVSICTTGDISNCCHRCICSRAHTTSNKIARLEAACTQETITSILFENGLATILT